MFDQLNTTRELWLASLESNLNTTIANLIDEIDGQGIQNENDVTLRYMVDLSNAYFVDAYLYGAIIIQYSLMPTLDVT